MVGKEVGILVGGCVYPSIVGFDVMGQRVGDDVGRFVGSDVDGLDVG